MTKPSCPPNEQPDTHTDTFVPAGSWSAPGPWVEVASLGRKQWPAVPEEQGPAALPDVAGRAAVGAVLPLDEQVRPRSDALGLLRERGGIQARAEVERTGEVRRHALRGLGGAAEQVGRQRRRRQQGQRHDRARRSSSVGSPSSTSADPSGPARGHRQACCPRWSSSTWRARAPAPGEDQPAAGAATAARYRLSRGGAWPNPEPASASATNRSASRDQKKPTWLPAYQPRFGRSQCCHSR
jgi:hypothetical protein